MLNLSSCPCISELAKTTLSSLVKTRCYLIGFIEHDLSVLLVYSSIHSRSVGQTSHLSSRPLHYLSHTGILVPNPASRENLQRLQRESTCSTSRRDLEYPQHKSTAQRLVPGECTYHLFEPSPASNGSYSLKRQLSHYYPRNGYEA